MSTPILPPTPMGIQHAARLLQQGLLVSMPTETVYGLAADARNGDAVASIYRVKGRPSFNPLIVHVANLDAAAEIAHLTPAARALAQRFWPGALSMVLPLRQDARLSSLVTAGLQTVAIRVPAHPVAQALLEAFGGPLAAPSANISGRISPTRVDHVTDPEGGLDGQIAGIIDGGACRVGVESTIVGWDENGTPRLLRPGGIEVAQLEWVLDQPLRQAQPGDQGETSQPSSPGQLLSHYAPRAEVRLNAESARDGEFLLGFGPVGGDMSLSLRGNVDEAAANLFAMLRLADEKSGGTRIAVAPIPDDGLGLAINDRLRRAASPR